LDNHTHNSGGYNIPGIGVVVGASGTPVSPAPDDSNIVDDKNYIESNQNLAITGVYTPK
jgi:hypothetical protein